MSELRPELKYLSTHEWARLEEDGTVTIGITDHAQEALGDVVFVDLPEVGTNVSIEEESAVVESVKAASDIYAPLSGEVVAINNALDEEPEIVNSSPYDDGWFYKVKPSNIDDLDKALSASEYQAQIDSE